MVSGNGVTIRSLRLAYFAPHSPRFTIVAILSLALGIGATTAILTVVDAVILKPLPYPQPEQLVQLWMRFTGIGHTPERSRIGYPRQSSWICSRTKSFSQICAMHDESYNVNVSGVPERDRSAVVSPSFFPMLGVQAQHGRVFLPEEGHASHRDGSFC